MRNFMLLFLFIGLATLAGCGRGSIDRGQNISRSEILLQHNKFRSIADVDQMSHDSVLEQKAQAWAEYMAQHDNMVHSHLSMSGDFVMLGENIAMGQEDIDDVMQAWMNSTGHRHNILNPEFTHAGFGYARMSDGSPYWCAQFGAKGEN
jgi:uncharacterized protein YkwD